jgi:hypothetical protein
MFIGFVAQVFHTLLDTVHGAGRGSAQLARENIVAFFSNRL